MPTSSAGEARRVSVTGGADGTFRVSNGATSWDQRRDGPDGVRAVDLVLSALAICVAGTIRASAAVRGIDGLEEVHVTVRAIEAGAPARLESVNVSVSFAGSLDPHDARRLHQVGQHCKIHQILSRGVSVRFAPLDQVEVVPGDGGAR